ncbi:protein ARV 2-like isoform X1 [Ipomoea triloba]|uniref:protein ARV 2-like isoform X1 n=2 Tax=Ipomoea triloba TaxID=35885 RepID=UPI00125DB1DD|nr:protein ARV 2-like isoform X1 [Ipomoea triloba]
MDNGGKFRCVECGLAINSLYIQYSPGNIRLMKCENCKAVADEYIECEIMILMIDLILHKREAYMHLFYNMFTREKLKFEGLLWKSLLGFLLMDSYRVMVLSTSPKERIWPASFNSFLSIYGKVLYGVLFGNLIFLGMLLFGTRRFLNATSRESGFRSVLLAILVSSYLKIFLVAMMVWEFPRPVIFIIDMFVFSSNTLALKVVTDKDMIRCLWICLAAHTMKLFIEQSLIGFPAVSQIYSSS